MPHKIFKLIHFFLVFAAFGVLIYALNPADKVCNRLSAEEKWQQPGSMISDIFDCGLG